MRYRALGHSGLIVSVVGLGGNNFGQKCDLDQTRRIVTAALDAGIILFDTADAYGNLGGSETMLGEVLKGRRDEVVIATKFGWDMKGANGSDWGSRGSRRYIRRAIDASLTRLQTDYIDLYQYHVPDGITPIEETLAALDDLVREGKVRYIGSSNFSAWQIIEADLVARRDRRIPFVSAQNEYSFFNRSIEAELMPACQRYGIGILAYSPLANGLLTGKYKKRSKPPADSRLAKRSDMLTEENLLRVERLESYAAARELSCIDVAIGALAAQPAVGSVIAGATSPEQVTENAAASTWVPSTADLEALDQVTKPIERPSV